MTFDEFFTAESRRLVRLCYLLTLDRGAAAELVQETMLRAWQRWDSLGDQSPAAWVTTVAVNLSRNRRRRIALEMRRIPMLVNRTPTPVRHEDLLDLRRALRRLPARQREALVLVYWGGLTMNDCAEAMGVSTGTVKQHLSRAHRTLRASLAPSILELQEEPS